MQPHVTGRFKGFLSGVTHDSLVTPAKSLVYLDKLRISCQTALMMNLPINPWTAGKLNELQKDIADAENGLCILRKLRASHIRQLRKDGHTLQQIGEAVGLSFKQVQRISQSE
jgi:hypothetical protein